MGKEIGILRPEIEFVAKLEDFVCANENERRALELAIRAHGGVFRRDGEPYINHCIAVAGILRSWGITDSVMIAAALLHDSKEDTDWVTLQMIEEIFEDREFGREVASLVDGVSKFETDDGEDDDEKTTKKMLISSSIDPRVALIRFADRYHNTLTLGAMPPNKQKAKAIDTLTVYTEYAKALGLWVLASDLEDRSFAYADRGVYEEVRHQIDNDPRLDEEFLSYWMSFLDWWINHRQDELGGAVPSLEGRIELRVKGYYGATQKRDRLAREGRGLAKSFDEVSDLVSFRIILKDLHQVDSCRGRLRREFSHMLEDRSDDTITEPDLNGYSAYHEILKTKRGLIEVAITTEEREAFNNWGVVYLMRLGNTNLSEYVLKPIITPLDEVLFLPPKATGVDLAYLINPQLGAEAEYMVVDGVKTALSAILPPAARVKIVPGPRRRAPNPQIGQYALPATRKMIKKQLLMDSRTQESMVGRRMTEEVIKERGIFELEDAPSVMTDSILYDLDCLNLEVLYYLIGSGALQPEDLKVMLDGLNLTKENLGCTSIRLSGTDRPGVLDVVTHKISEKKGNIADVRLQIGEGRFSLKIIVKDLSKEAEAQLRTELETLAVAEQVEVI